MPLIVFALIVLLVAQVGFWHALGAIIGAVAMIALLLVLALAIFVSGGLALARRLGGARRHTQDSWQ